MSMTGEGGSSSDYRHRLPSGLTNSGDDSYLNSTNTCNATGILISPFSRIRISPDHRAMSGPPWKSIFLPVLAKSRIR